MGKFTDDVPLKPKGSVQPPSAHLLIRNLKGDQHLLKPNPRQSSSG
jgi:hypothetical protein